MILTLFPWVLVWKLSWEVVDVVPLYVSFSLQISYDSASPSAKRVGMVPPVFALLLQVAIPVVPTVRVVITFTKFVELPPTDHFYTPLSSPCLLANGSVKVGPDEGQESDGHVWPWTSSSSTSVSSWIKRGSSRSAESQPEPQHCSPQQLDTFTIPSGYTWKSLNDKSRKLKKSKVCKKV